MTVLYYYKVKKEKKSKLTWLILTWVFISGHFIEKSFGTLHIYFAALYIYTVDYYSTIKKEWNNAIWSNMNGSRDCHTEWSKSDGERQILYVIIYMCARACKVASVMSVCDPMHHGFPGSSDHGILQARILEWVATFSSRRSSWPRDQTRVSYISWIGRQILYH